MQKLAIFIIFLVAGCATSPTGRKQIMLVSDENINKMGVQAFNDIKKQKPQTRNLEYQRLAGCILQKILPHTDQLSLRWEIVVFHDPSPNAFALPGGKMGIHTGMFNVARNQDQLAAVIGHEIAHVIARHGAEQVSQGLVAQVGLAGLQVLTYKKGQKKQQLMLLGAQLLTQFAFMLPRGRTQESEADEMGVYLMAKAGFNPKESIELWKNMERVGGYGPPEFLSTHPSHSSRIDRLKKHMPKAMHYYRSTRQAQCSMRRY